MNTNKNINQILFTAMSHATMADSYKFSQYAQYRPHTENIDSYIEFRGSKRFTKSVFAGFSIFLQQVMARPVTKEEIDYAEGLIAGHGEPFNRAGWDYILEKHSGFLPLRIKAVPEGSVIPLSNVLVTVENTDPNCAWLTSFKETVMLPAVWYPSLVATVSYHIREICQQFLDETSDNPEAIGFMLNDFGFRGVSSSESSGIGGFGHLTSFMGTDNIAAMIYAREFYDAKTAGYSIPAMEHSTVTSWERNGEYDAFDNMINKFGNEDAIFACVIDSYDTMGAVKNHWLDGGLLNKVKERKARVVLRPDSGDPTKVPVEVIELLMENLAEEVTVNSKGFKVLPNYVRVIQGDGINQESIRQILQNLKDRGISACNIVFGMGGKLLQAELDRDTMEAAMKCSSTTVQGRQIDVYKQPKTDSKKNSKRGKLTLVCENGEYKTIRIEDMTDAQEEVLQLVYENGKLFNLPTLEDIRNRINSSL